MTILPLNPRRRGAEQEVLRGVRREGRNARRHVRVRLPVSVELDGKAYQARDLSLEGFALEGLPPEYQPGQTVACRVMVLFADFDFAMPLTAKIVRRSEDPDLTGFQITDLQENQARLLRYLIQAHLSGQIATADDLLTLDQATTPRRLALAGNSAEQDAAQVRRATIWFRYGLFSLAGIALLAVAAGLLYGRLLTIRSDYAALTAPRTDIVAPAKGRFQISQLVPGQNVGAGQPIVRVDDPDEESRLAVARAGVRVLEQTRRNLDEQLGERRGFFRQYTDIAKSELAAVEARLRSATTDLALAQRNEQRVNDLRDRGIVTLTRVDDAHGATARAQELVHQRRMELQAAQTNVRIAASGNYYTGDRGNGGDPGAVGRQIRETEAALALERARVAAIEQQLVARRIASPCDCTVHQILAANGQWVEEGAPLVVLTSAKASDLMIEARVPQEKAAALQLYQTATVRFSDASEPIEARVMRIEREGARLPRAGLPDSGRGSLDAASILLTPTEPLRGYSVGVPATVQFPLGLNGLLFSWFGVS